jgi:hypothetical protein
MEGSEFMNMTKREMMAAMAMQGYLTADGINESSAYATVELAKLDGIPPAQYMASRAIEYADALIAELDRTNSTVKESLTTPDDDGWIEHTPGDAMPCGGNERVEVMFMFGEVSIMDLPAKARDWGSECNLISKIIKWRPAR